MNNLRKTLQSADSVLASAGWIAAFLVLVSICAAPWDARTVVGVNPWVKSMKYCGAIAVYLWTMAALLQYLPGPRWAVAAIRWGVAGTMLAEGLLIGLQSLRGVASHFNAGSGTDTLIFGAIVAMAVLNTLLVFFAFFHFLWQEIELPRAFLLGIRMGMVMFVLGSLVGGVLMLVNQGAVVGKVDMRWAHLAGMSGLIALPMAGHAVSRWCEERTVRSQLFLVTGAGSCWILLFALALR